jgi:radical SAM protein with 4Fe4S-binding SPASM domain
MPCLIGYAYLRIQTDGSVMACCSSPFPMGKLNEKSLEDIWHSNAYYLWREKFKNIQNSHFHLKELEFSFCKICPHLNPNYPLNKDLNIERK